MPRVLFQPFALRLFENETDQDCYLKPGDTRVPCRDVEILLAWSSSFDSYTLRAFWGMIPKIGHMEVSKNGSTPKWMVKIMENRIKMDDLGGPPLFSETSICSMQFRLLEVSLRLPKGRLLIFAIQCGSSAGITACLPKSMLIATCTAAVFCFCPVFFLEKVHYSPPLGAESIQENWAGSLTLELPITRRHPGSMKGWRGISVVSMASFG